MNPYQVTKDFEAALCAYTGAPFAVALNSCTAALLLCVRWNTTCGIFLANPDGQFSYGFTPIVEIPRKTYVSVAMSIKHASCEIAWRDEDWCGCYQLKPLPVWDCARRFTSGMYVAGQFQCVSFAASKILAAEQGGAILHDNEEADGWFRRMRFDGRTEGVDPLTDPIKEIGHHCIMTPSVAAGLLVRLHHLPRHNPDMGGDLEKLYPDLSTLPAFR